MIKILIADDQELIRQSLMIILSSVEDFYVTDTAADGEEVIQSVKREKPDVIRTSRSSSSRRSTMTSMYSMPSNTEPAVISSRVFP